MKKLRKFLATPGVSLCAIALGILLLGTSTVGGAQAAITYYSDPYQANVELQQIRVQLNENETPNVRKLSMDKVMENGEALKLGYAYQEELSVTNPTAKENNTSNITEYVRVTIRRYWTDAAGDKQYDLDPSLIELRYGDKLLGTDVPGGDWIEDTNARTPERIVLYYTKPVAPNDTVKIKFCDTLTINEKVGRTGTRNADGSITYTYNGMQFKVDVQVDAIQNGHVQAAALSAWGTNISLSGDTITKIG